MTAWESNGNGATIAELTVHARIASQRFCQSDRAAQGHLLMLAQKHGSEHKTNLRIVALSGPVGYDINRIECCE